jgi:acyl-CoA synthetase (AMP-forming)/AMP-acid ligase II
MTDLLDHFDAAVARHPERVAIVDGTGRDVTYQELSNLSKALAETWRSKGVKAGDRVLLAMGVTAELYASLAALWSLGATVVLPEPAMGLRGLRHAVRVTRPKAFCASGAYGFLKLLLPGLWGTPVLRPKARSAALKANKRVKTEVALISFTSGTTGAPKAIPRSHFFLMAQYDAVAPILESAREERDLVAFPVFTLVNLAAGRTSILPSWKMSRLAQLTPGRLADWLRQTRATRALLPPSLAALLPQAGKTDLHHVFTGGGPVFPHLVKQLQNEQAVDVTCVYGSTEAEPIAHLQGDEIGAEDMTKMAAGAGLLVGHPVPEVRLRIRNGEIEVTGDHVNKSYLDPAQTRENKVFEGDEVWHRTGDAGRLDAQGRLWLLGRVGDEVSGAQGPIHPFAAEVAAQAWPGVTHCAIMEKSGEPILAIEGAAEHLPKWKANAEAFGVERVEVISAMPLDVRHRSKIDRVKLAKVLQD